MTLHNATGLKKAEDIGLEMSTPVKKLWLLVQAVAVEEFKYAECSLFRLIA